MANQSDETGRSSDLQKSQSGGETGQFGGNRDQSQHQQPIGGGATPSDMSSAGGSSGTGGYGNMQNQQNHQGQGSAPSGLADGETSQRGGAPSGQSRGERYDEEQGGGRGEGTFAHWDEGGASGSSDELKRDQEEHQDRGQSRIEFDENRR